MSLDRRVAFALFGGVVNASFDTGESVVVPMPTVEEVRALGERVRGRSVDRVARARVRSAAGRDPETAREVGRRVAAVRMRTGDYWRCPRCRKRFESLESGGADSPLCDACWGIATRNGKRPVPR